jgi:hypothetical protein
MLSVIYALCHLCIVSSILRVTSNQFKLSVIMMNVILLNAVVLSVIMLNVIMLSVVMLSVVAPKRGTKK